MELVNELALFERAPEEVTVTLQEFEDAGFGEKPVWKAFVAENDGLIIGFAVYYIRYSTWKGNRMYLEDLIVTESMRGKKVGKLLFDRLIAIFRHGRGTLASPEPQMRAAPPTGSKPRTGLSQASMKYEGRKMTASMGPESKRASQSRFAAVRAQSSWIFTE